MDDDQKSVENLNSLISDFMDPGHDFSDYLMNGVQIDPEDYTSLLAQLKEDLARRTFIDDSAQIEPEQSMGPEAHYITIEYLEDFLSKVDTLESGEDAKWAMKLHISILIKRMKKILAVTSKDD